MSEFCETPRAEKPSARRSVVPEPIRTNRFKKVERLQNAPPIAIDHARLTIFAAIQPGTLDTISGDKNHERGLPCRFAYVFPPSKVASRPTNNPPLDQAGFAPLELQS